MAKAAKILKTGFENLLDGTMLFYFHWVELNGPAKKAIIDFMEENDLKYLDHYTLNSYPPDNDDYLVVAANFRDPEDFVRMKIIYGYPD